MRMDEYTGFRCQEAEHTGYFAVASLHIACPSHVEHDTSCYPIEVARGRGAQELHVRQGYIYDTSSSKRRGGCCKAAVDDA